MNVSPWIDAFAFVLQPGPMLYLLFGTVLGLIIGGIPGLGPMFAITLVLPLTFYMDAATAIIFLVSIHCSATAGGAWSAVLINTPGTTGNVATAWDGYPLAQQGKSGPALGAATLASFLGGVFGWVTLVLVSPLLVKIALQIGSAEYTMLGFLALSMLSVASGSSAGKGLILGLLGLAMSFVGRDLYSNTPRFTFGIHYLFDGLPLISVVLGLFAFSEVLSLAASGLGVSKVSQLSGKVTDGFREVMRRPVPLLRASVVGTVLGALPAIGVSLANVVAYFVEKRAAKDPDSFGKGNFAGVIAPEAANNACAVAELVPTLTLGIPGAIAAAIFLAALSIHGVPVGPSLFQAGGIGFKIYAGVLISQVLFTVIGGVSLRWVAKVTLVPSSVLLPLVTAMTFFGAYAERNEVRDIIATIVFGLFGYYLRRHGWPVACIVLGFVLGPLIETNFVRTLMLSEGSFAYFFERPISLGIFIVTAAFLLMPLVTDLRNKYRAARQRSGRAA